MPSLKALLLPTILSVAANPLLYRYHNDERLTECPSTSTKTATSFDDEWGRADYCFKKIPFTAIEYSSQVSLASAQAVATNKEPLTNVATSTSTSSGSSSTTASASVTPTTNAAMSLDTAKGVVVGGAGVFAALFAL
ncbi:hypothetical protein N7471_012847 [Penicillium samsonianum]|uniref:uncharacterized protein n=1 Tax=Penicillium samsonianum TaxID=1882272 RepID=UPI0025492849|nr:uncharacterized protein N7471_012847 [Penicillium samsonianum]KAJ6125530.1 hypothetical protein N7471_012847 [Penicillium samsonianum]